MPKEQPIIYEPHPVTVARKAELRGQGYKILDAVFAPPGTKVALPAAALTPPAGGISDAVMALALANGNFMAFKSAAKKVLGDALPAKKPEIVAALEALAGGDVPVSETPDGIATPIPDAWEAMTEEEMIALAAELIGGDVVVSGNGESQAEKAHSIIMATVTDRANPPAK